jgi:hypothetical protein
MKVLAPFVVRPAPAVSGVSGGGILSLLRGAGALQGAHLCLPKRNPSSRPIKPPPIGVLRLPAMASMSSRSPPS